MRTDSSYLIQDHFEYGLPHPAIIASTGVGSAEFAIPAPRAGRPRRPWSDGETALLQQCYADGGAGPVDRGAAPKVEGQHLREGATARAEPTS